jgi:hypothetical protein
MEQLREAPVHQVDLAEIADHDVGRFEIAVHDPAMVRIRERVADLEQDLDAPPRRDRCSPADAS